MGLSVSLINIDKEKSVNLQEPDEKSLIGFCYPTHGFNAPPVMLDFMISFPRMKNADVFFMNTRAGMKLYKIFTPGLSGIALWFPALIFLLKGYRIRAMRSADLPSNWIPIHPGIRPKVCESIVGYWEGIVRRFAVKMFTGKRVLRAWVDLIPDLLIMPVSIGYYFLGRFFLAKTYIASSDCNNCGLCSKQCPVSAIKTINDRPFWTYKCESCMRCLNTCPKRAIETPHGFAAVIVIAVIFLNGLLCSWLLDQNWIPGKDTEWYSWIEFTLWNVIAFPLLFGSYWFMHKLTNIKAFNKIITYTSLTKFGFWRRYKFPKG